ncbi:MAG: hypothetical protein KatS3mg131_0599 [Candidatus Tectimicrobiota bacterium]|nr:MAG: hypothetical protein KatS3mg131_0599 [Candidatus Tectomicrobia bacterium]
MSSECPTSRILIVDDELGPREALRMILKTRHAVATASSGAEALELVRRCPPDLVFLDIKMREMDGIEVLKAIKAFDATIEVVMMTAYASLDTARQAMSYGASEYLIKPFSKAEVENAVAKALARRAAHTGTQHEVRVLLERMRALAEAAQRGTDADSLAQMGRSILAQGCQVLQAAAAVLHRVADDRFPCQLAFQLPPAHLTALEHPAWHATLEHAFLTGQPLLVSAMEAPASEASPVLQQLACQASALFPVVVGEEPLGLLAFFYPEPARVPAGWQERGRTFADLMAVAIHTHRRWQASRQEAVQQAQRAAQLGILREVTRVIMDCLDLEAMLHAIGEQLRTGLGYSGVHLWLYDPATGAFQDAYHAGTAPDWQPSLQGVPAALEVQDTAAGQVIVAPLVLDKRQIGVVQLLRQPQHGPLADFERELLCMVLDHLALAVKNAQLYGEMCQTKSYLQSLIDGAGDAIFTVDTRDTITSWNSSAERLFQYPAAEVLQRPVTVLLPEAPYQAWRQAVLQHGSVQHLETQLARRDGTPVDVSMTLSPLRGAHDEIVGFSAIIKDVTQDKRLREQLWQAEKLRAVGEMAAGVAHNFNNILTTILGHTQLLLDDPGDVQAVRRGLTIIETAARDAAHIVQRIQTFARGHGDAAFILTDLVQVVKEAVDTTRPLWKERACDEGRPIDLVLDLAPVPPFSSRAAELREVLTNLILNAVDAMPAGGTLTLRTYTEGAWACLEVADTGIGMSDEVRRRIFDPFFTTKAGKGSGLGLSVSYTLIKALGGSIDVRSAPRQGTTFVIRLPLG